MKSFLAGVCVLAAAQGLSLAASAQPSTSHGECFGRVVLPPTVESRAVRVLQSPGGVERRVIPAVVEHAWRKVLVRPAHEERITLPALYRTVSSSYLVAGPRRYESTPARYEVQTERVLVSPGHWTWERRFGRMASGPPQPGQTVVEPTGEIMCKVWCPARFDYVQRRVMVSPGRSYAVATTVRRYVAHRVLVRPAVTAVRQVPAEYRDIALTRVVRPARIETYRIPARYGVVQDRRMVSGGEGWAPVVCGGPLSHFGMQRLQTALAQRGYDPGATDGYGRPQTYEALRRFQMDHHMPAGQITVQSAQALGVVP
jgi:hypothetical protein